MDRKKMVSAMAKGKAGSGEVKDFHIVCAMEKKGR